MPPGRPLKKKGRKQQVPYARGFSPPSAKARLEAIGIPVNTDKVKHLEVSDGFFDLVPKPSSQDDWLAQYNDEGQTFKRFCKVNPWLSTRKVKNIKHAFFPEGTNIAEKYPKGKIYIVLLGEFDGARIDLRGLIEYAGIFFQLPVVFPGAVSITQTGDSVSWVDSAEAGEKTKQHRLQSRYNKVHKRIQISVDSLLQRLQASIPDDALCMIGLTMYDLYADDTDLFVAGMAAGARRVGVFSLFRYDPMISFSPELWYDISENEAESQELCRYDHLLLLRSCRLLVHELSHLLGVDHCIFFSCCMNGSGHLEEDFRQPMFLCPVDLHKLERLCGFNVLNRYKDLLHFYAMHKMTDEANWVARRIDFINGDEYCF